MYLALPLPLPLSFTMLAAAAFSAVLALASPAFGLAAPRDTTLAAPVQIDASKVTYNMDINATIATTRERMRKRSCGDYNTAAIGTANALQSMYYSSGGMLWLARCASCWLMHSFGHLGYYNGGSAWTDVVSSLFS